MIQAIKTSDRIKLSWKRRIIMCACIGHRIAKCWEVAYEKIYWSLSKFHNYLKKYNFIFHCYSICCYWKVIIPFLTNISLLLKVFVLMQFDPGLEYKNIRGRGITNQGSGTGGGGSNKDDNSWLLLCSALTDGPYSYI